MWWQIEAWHVLEQATDGRAFAFTSSTCVHLQLETFVYHINHIATFLPHP